MRVLSAGEVTKGMYVAVYEINFPHRYTCGMTGALREEILTDKHSWLKGIPFKILDVNGPIIAVDTLGFHHMLPRITFFDSRFHKFVESSKSFYNIYVKAMRQQIKSQNQCVQNQQAGTPERVE
jgi:hypothetical protein